MKFILATKNPKKLSEMQRILLPLGVDVISEREFGELPEAVENGETFAQNARIKALSAMNASGLPAIADDSGLCVDALGGAPGVYSARFSGDHDDKANNDKLLFELSDVPPEKRTARFVCNICCVFPNGDELTAHGECEGMIGYVPKGENGFGYDPLFMVGDKSFSELSSEQKDNISHRGNAMRDFAEKLKQYIKENNNDK